jgi:formylglycine-generating enzyme required for sulfatase activity
VQSKGFVPVAQENGMLIAYATAEGELASDVGAGAGPYAKVLAEEIVKPGIEAVVMFRAVQRRVRAAIRQEPYLGFNALGDVYLAGKSDAAISRPVVPGDARPQSSEAAEAWAAAKDTNSVDVLEDFIRRYKDTFYAGLSRARLDELKKQQMAVVVPPKAPEPAPQTRPTMTTPPAVPSPGRCDGVETQVGSEKRCLNPKDSFKDCPACPEMVVVPSGNFAMGSPANEPERNDGEAQVRVSIHAPFAVGKFAVTFDEWDACVADAGCSGYKGALPKDEGWGREKQPVINVNWRDAKAYTSWLSRKTGETYRLLSEAEREYVTRARTTTPFWWGSSITPKQANYDGSVDPYEGGGSKGENRKRTVPVDGFQPNPWGLYNVHGNVWEWTEDCWNDSNTGNPGDGRARTTGTCTERVARGGSWVTHPLSLRSAHRFAFNYGASMNTTGFRVARTLKP